ncbi:thermonuclease family protein [Actinomycetospora atypica]|uniref:Thermonuclease family protein n=1 Tax=Actinomycetospora atypica TaxID=1290095 RepID=A0ABV9YP44_9PSEU
MGNHGNGPATGAHRAVGPGRHLPLLLTAVGGVVLLGLGVLLGLVLGRGSGGAAAAAPVAAVAPTSTPTARAADATAGAPPTLMGEVVRVDTGDEVVVRVGTEEVVVGILGIDAPEMAGPTRTTGECGAAEALRFADRTLSGQTVTLVPDPTIPAVDDRGRRLAYVVLPTQLSYTDAAISAGVVTADTSRRLWYAPVFAREQAEAVKADRGMWGDPCDATPGRPLRAGT